MLEYRTQGNGATADTKRAFNDYGLNATPTAVFNGAAGQVMRGPQPQSVYKARIDQLDDKQSTALITISEEGSHAAAVLLANLSTQAIENAEIYAITYEDAGNGQEHFQVRNVIDLTPKQMVTLAGHTVATFDLKSIPVDAVQHLVIILKATSGAIIQSLFVR